jgi:hypothetical protein
MNSVPARLETLLSRETNEYINRVPILKDGVTISNIVSLHASVDDILIQNALPFLTSLCRQLNLQLRLTDSPPFTLKNKPFASLLFAEVSLESKDLFISALSKNDPQYEKCFLSRYSRQFN